MIENVRSFVDSVVKAKPQGAKGTYMKKISVSSTMGPGVKVALGQRRRAERERRISKIPADDRRTCPRLRVPPA